LTDLAISLYLPLQQISDVSVHSSAQQDNYIQTSRDNERAFFFLRVNERSSISTFEMNSQQRGLRSS